MEFNSKNRRLGVLTVLAIVIYIALILSSFFSGIDYFMLGFEEGSKKATSMKEDKIQTKNLTTVYFLDLKAKPGYSTFPDSISNLKGNGKVAIRYDKAQAHFENFTEKGANSSFYNISQIILSLLTLVIITMIPVFFIKLNVRLKKEMVFDKRNIKNMRCIGVLLLLYYLVSFLQNWVVYSMNIQVFEFRDYVIQFEQADLIWVLLGVVVLLFAEVLSRGSQLKEEQELTI